AAMLTLPFLFAATVQAALRSDISLLARAALGYLPLAMLSIGIAAPLTTLGLAASDEMSGLITSTAGDAGQHLITRLGIAAVGIPTLALKPFLGFLVGLLVIGAAFALWIELLLREAAVYVVVLMLPLAFAALTWPARRIWAIRAIELLVALILSKFAIAAVLSLGGAAINASLVPPSITGLMAGTVLLMLAAMSPWALLRLVPLAEIASGAAGALRGELHSTTTATTGRPVGYANAGAEWVGATTAAMKRDAQSQMAAQDDAPDPGATGEGPDLPSGGPDFPAGGSLPGPGGAPTPGGAEAPDTPRDPAPTPRDPPWSERSVIELGPNLDKTRVWPHPEAE
ncbi:MAG: hypothetical protein JO130_17770, partial [Solirubrobacterales bacterium]|nr:hypothetical protein [Solirubrobacterales bacterium]